MTSWIEVTTKVTVLQWTREGRIFSHCFKPENSDSVPAVSESKMTVAGENWLEVWWKRNSALERDFSLCSHWGSASMSDWGKVCRPISLSLPQKNPTENQCQYCAENYLIFLSTDNFWKQCCQKAPHWFLLIPLSRKGDFCKIHDEFSVILKWDILRVKLQIKIWKLP